MVPLRNNHFSFFKTHFMASLNQKVVLVTGASKGIGAGIALEMGRQGAQVIVHYATDAAGAQAVVDRIQQAGGTACALPGDLSEEATVQALFAEISTRFGTLNVLVNNAGIYEFAPLEGATEASYRRMFDVNVWALVLIMQQAIPLFTAAGGGSIINISSFASVRPEPYSLLYGATKSAVDSLTTSLSQELGPKNIRVNSIRPGGVFTEGVAKMGATQDSEPIQQMVRRSALGRMATPADIAPLAVFLASEDAALITGQMIEVSGGFK